MNTGYVYIARVVGHNGDLFPRYHKIGITTNDFKVRESQLNSTHLPFDVVMVRVFETNNYDIVEKILHESFKDYRVVKELVSGKKMVTEWFDFEEEDTMLERVNKQLANLGKMLKVTELDLETRISQDKTITSRDKVELETVVNKVKKSISKYIYLEVDGKNETQDSGIDTYLYALNIIANLIGGYNNISNYYKNTLKSFILTNCEEVSIEKNNSMQNSNKKHYGIINDEKENYFVWKNLDNTYKYKVLKSLISHFNLNSIKVELKETN